MKKFIIGIMMSLCAATSFAQTASDIGVLRARMKICIVQYSSIVKSATMEIRSQNYEQYMKAAQQADLLYVQIQEVNTQLVQLGYKPQELPHFPQYYRQTIGNQLYPY